MLLIVEGQRNVGKTTAIAEFIEMANKPTSPLAKFKPENLNYARPYFPVAQIIRDFCQKGFDNDRVWITDRGHISEQVYAEHTMRRRNWEHSEMSWAEYFLSLSNTLVIHLTMNAEELERREKETGKPSEGDIRELARLFAMYIKRTPLNSITIPCEGKTPQDIAKIIERNVYNSVCSYKEIP